MHPFVLDPDSVRIGDWRELGARAAVYHTPRSARKKSKGLFFVVLMLAAAALWIETHQGVSKETAAAPPASAREAINLLQNPPPQQIGRADARTLLPLEFVDDWTFVYPAPLPR
jgi:hypothetical protein